ncbi:MAG: FkbM family methyltransferase [Deltaproteobacteria bacterium]|nr:FkbM family methyltransferase [Deltaproteobacteria bacterium]
MLSLFKPYVERYPAIANTYRRLRAFWSSRNRRLRTTAAGFQLIGDDSMADGSFEPDETILVQNNIGSYDVFVDVGAHVGFFTCLAGSRGRRTVSVEPCTDNLTLLYKNLVANGLDHAEVFPVGIAAEPGLRVLYGGGTGASVVPGWAGASLQYARVIPVTTLDTLLSGRFESRRLFVKIDIEGGEFDALRGASETLSRSPHPTWLVEICLAEHWPRGQTPHFREVFEVFWHHGYQARTLDAARQIVTSDDISRWVKTNRRGFGTHNFVFTDPNHVLL